MRSLSSIGLGLSVVFTCLLLALIAEIYYLLWWKRRIIRREVQNDYNSNAAREYLHMFCCRKKTPTLLPTSLVNPSNAPQIQQDFQFHVENKDYFLKPFGENDIEGQLITGPPRFLFTIMEETREDLESEDAKSREGKRCLSDLMKRIETPYLTPLSSPQFLTSPLTPMGSCHSSQSGSCGGYNPFYEASNDAEFSKMVKTSPPPKFKFLRDADEKLQRKNMLIEEARNKAANVVTIDNQNQDDGSFIGVIVNKNNEIIKPNHHYHSPQCHSCSSSSSQVFPLASTTSKN